MLLHSPQHTALPVGDGWAEASPWTRTTRDFWMTDLSCRVEAKRVQRTVRLEVTHVTGLCHWPKVVPWVCLTFWAPEKDVGAKVSIWWVLLLLSGLCWVVLKGAQLVVLLRICKYREHFKHGKEGFPKVRIFANKLVRTPHPHPIRSLPDDKPTLCSKN